MIDIFGVVCSASSVSVDFVGCAGTFLAFGRFAIGISFMLRFRYLVFVGICPRCVAKRWILYPDAAVFLEERFVNISNNAFLVLV